MSNKSVVKPDRLLTPDEVSKILNIPIQLLADWRWRKVGIPYLKVRRIIRYKQSEVDAYLTASEVRYDHI